jgi:pimeloyl-ACP methyl ester carboxylesterase
MPMFRAWEPTVPFLGRQTTACRESDSDAHFEKIEDAAHAVFLDQPERFDE